ncbi:heat shock protein transcriptional repressor HspR [Enteractinococcus coprophilus]|uniref:MerR family transcriptional regulator/heat shock protein HspR n=1 Tax=Enteractinococcus coprophilus TaxID=1027633 RepID=A0A543AM98_9MICC|nr:MerR family transcriptional regulator/heat shock protein HspR [Enteractinococcus coprophilus]
MVSRHKHDPVYVISVAAQLADMHPQTLRQYDRMGLVVPARQAGGQRRYSAEDVRRLRRIQSLSRDGVSLEGIRRIVELEEEVQELRDTVSDLVDQIAVMRSHVSFSRTFTAGSSGVTTNIHGLTEPNHQHHDDAARAYREERRRQRFDRDRVEQAVMFALEQSTPRYALNRPRYALPR